MWWIIFPFERDPKKCVSTETYSSTKCQSAKRHSLTHAQIILLIFVLRSFPKILYVPTDIVVYLLTPIAPCGAKAIDEFPSFHSVLSPSFEFCPALTILYDFYFQISPPAISWSPSFPSLLGVPRKGLPRVVCRRPLSVAQRSPLPSSNLYWNRHFPGPMP